jgi:hypothetical protein
METTCRRSPAGLSTAPARYAVTAIVIKTSPPHWVYDFTDCPKLPFCPVDFASAWAKPVFHNADYAVFVVEPSVLTHSDDSQLQ